MKQNKIRANTTQELIELTLDDLRDLVKRANKEIQHKEKTPDLFDEEGVL